jgi:hypothetical protein
MCLASYAETSARKSEKIQTTSCWVIFYLTILYIVVVSVLTQFALAIVSNLGSERRRRGYGGKDAEKIHYGQHPTVTD